MGTLHFLNKQASEWHSARTNIAELEKKPFKGLWQPLYEVRCPTLWAGSRLLSSEALLALQEIGGYDTWTRALNGTETPNLPFLDKQEILNLLMSLQYP